MELKPCPCGKTPEKLSICEGSTYRWRIVMGDCCGEWTIEAGVRDLYGDDDEQKLYDRCAQAWNAAPRGEK